VEGNGLGFADGVGDHKRLWLVAGALSDNIDGLRYRLARDPARSLEQRWLLRETRHRALASGALRCCMVVTGLVTSAGVALAQSPGMPSPAGREPLPIRVTAENARLNNYIRELAGPKLLIGVMGGGLLEYLRDKPSYEDDGEYLAGRIAARAGQAAVQVSVHHGLAALMQRSTEYQPCACRGVGPKVEHALLETFTDRGADGSRAFSVPRFAGAYAGSFVRLVWEPHRSVGDVALNTTLSFGLTAVFNIARELAGVGR
jgi:hypothetical protein